MNFSYFTFIFVLFLSCSRSQKSTINSIKKDHQFIKINNSLSYFQKDSTHLIVKLNDIEMTPINVFVDKDYSFDSIITFNKNKIGGSLFFKNQFYTVLNFQHEYGGIVFPIIFENKTRKRVILKNLPVESCSCFLVDSINNTLYVLYTGQGKDPGPVYVLTYLLLSPMISYEEKTVSDDYLEKVFKKDSVNYNFFITVLDKANSILSKQIVH